MTGVYNSLNERLSVNTKCHYLSKTENNSSDNVNYAQIIRQ